MEDQQILLVIAGTLFLWMVDPCLGDTEFQYEQCGLLETDAKTKPFNINVKLSMIRK